MAKKVIKVLVVDDSRTIADLLKRALEQEESFVEFAVTTRTDAISGLKALHVGDFDLVLLDIGMPDQDGFETLRAIRNSRKLAHLPVVMLTAQGDRDTVVKAIRAGATDFVVKPFNLISLMEKLERALKTSGRLPKASEEKLVDELGL